MHHSLDTLQNYFPYEKLFRSLEGAEDVLTHKKYAEKYLEFAHDFVDILNTQVPVYTSFGTGYPFYLYSPEMPEQSPVQEYSSYLSFTKDKLTDHIRWTGDIGWRCPHCQEHNELPDLKTLCKPCTEVQFKPRDLFKALPDIDIFLVFDDKLIPDGLSVVSSMIAQRGFRASDKKIGNVISDFNSGITEGDMSKCTLLDVNVMGKSSLIEALQMSDRYDNNAIPIKSYRGDDVWIDEEYSALRADLIFSLTLLGKYGPASADIANAMQQQILSNPNIMTELRDRYDGTRIQRMLDNPDTSRLIHSAFAWRLSNIGL